MPTTPPAPHGPGDCLAISDRDEIVPGEIFFLKTNSTEALIMTDFMV
ncbi:MAG TPA: hypothetical protein VH307_08270 [Streptosporangiaceae bacterium]|nr:hypothetical protein [Streptosporangiaceae bacterium]